MLTLSLVKPETLRFRNSRYVRLAAPLLVGLLLVAQFAVGADPVHDKRRDVRTIVRDMLVAFHQQDADAALSQLYFADPEHAQLLTERMKQAGGSPTGYKANRPIYVVTDEPEPFWRPGQYLLLLPLRGEQYRVLPV